MPRSRPPGPRGRDAARTLRRLRGDSLQLLPELHAQHGDLVYLRAGLEHVYFVGSPELSREVMVTQGRRFAKGRGLERAKLLLGEGLLTSEGETHRRNRRLVQPAFHHERLPAYAEQMVECATETGDRWRDGDVVPMAAEMSALTLGIVTRTLFGGAAEVDPAAVGGAVTTFVGAFNRMVGPLGSVLLRLPTRSGRELKAARRLLDRTIAQLVAARRAEGTDTGDLLSMLLLAQDDDATRLGDGQVRDEAITLFLAGHETTANLLSWTWALLSQHPEERKRLLAELSAVLGDRRPSFADVPELTYTRAVLAETMRLYPPAWMIGRRAVEPVQLGEWQLPPGSLVLVAPWVVQRDARWWPEPDAFRPERWHDDDGDAERSFRYFPFGCGTRVCIGEQFAWLEGVLLLATLAQEWSPELLPGESLAAAPSVTLRPAGPLRMKVSRDA